MQKACIQKAKVESLQMGAEGRQRQPSHLKYDKNKGPVNVRLKDIH